MKNDDPKDMEELASCEHESWSRWCKWMLQEINREVLESASNPWLKSNLLGLLDRSECVARWRRQMETPYAALSEKEKESDRKVVREKLAAYRGPR